MQVSNSSIAFIRQLDCVRGIFNVCTAFSLAFCHIMKKKKCQGILIEFCGIDQLKEKHKCELHGNIVSDFLQMLT